jgi:hypothetical protein
LLGRAPYEGHILFGEVMKRPAYLGKVLDKALIEIGEPNKTPDFFEFCGWHSIPDSLYLDWIHRNFAGADDQSEVVDVELFKFTLLGSEI